ncbi:hypothetical protein KAK07_06380 [Ideonella sp. 4Y16]|uniref:Uncharacterized protein n=1 Tax=Ideonella alba TaxID=2824118 RepID=A0A940Y3F5_9BURK|nr:hypothetical protein [Ideonella alba]MBQ0929017.1 hypothetical protein [Ideonella alba]MBQ0942955.1 hypothetical protein [Ideonella alba]
MTNRSRRLSSALTLGLLASLTAHAQDSTPPDGSLRRHDALITLDYQKIKVPGDAPIDFMGFHLYHPVGERLHLGAGVYAPLVHGGYGGFMAFDLGAYLRQPISGPLFATAGLSAGGGGGGRSIAQSKVLSGTGGFVKGHVGLGWDFGRFAVGVNAAKVKFRSSAIDSTQANLFVEIPYSYLTGPFASQGTPLSAADERRAAAEVGENMLTVTLDNYRQSSPQGNFKGTLRLADLQYAHFFAPDTYWFGAIGVGYRGLPIYNQVLGGVGQRWRVAPNWALYGQLGLGSGGYSPEQIDTGPGLLVYPKLSAEYALSPTLGLSLSVGHMSAPKASSRNTTYGLALTHHLRPSRAGDEGPSHWQGFRVSLFHQTDFKLVYRDIARPPLQMIGIQVDTPLNERWYVPVQAAVAYNAYLGYPGYGELLTGLGLQSRAAASDRWQWFGQAMVGANVHGTAAKASGGVRYILDDQMSLSLNLGRLEARSSAGRRFSADTVGLGVDYRFSTPTR